MIKRLISFVLKFESIRVSYVGNAIIYTALNKRHELQTSNIILKEHLHDMNRLMSAHRDSIVPHK